MALPILIMGRSGSGKSASLRTASEDIFVINVNKKTLPFKTNERLKILNCDEYLKIKDAMKKAYDKNIKVAVIDDAGYLMTAKFMTGHRASKGNSGFELYNEIADNFYGLIKFITDELPNDMIVFLTMHEDKNDFGESKPKTIGKLLDDKVCIEGMFTIVLHSMKLDGKYVFATSTDGLDVTKTPIGMFDEEYIDNDIQYVINQVRNYYKN